jgi:hypothetical protein
MTLPSNSSQDSHGEQPSRCCHPGLLVVVGIVGVVSLAAAGFMGARWLGFLLLGVGCFLLVLVIRFLACE